MHTGLSDTMWEASKITILVFSFHLGTCAQPSGVWADSSLRKCLQPCSSLQLKYICYCKQCIECISGVFCDCRSTTRSSIRRDDDLLWRKVFGASTLRGDFVIERRPDTGGGGDRWNDEAEESVNSGRRWNGTHNVWTKGRKKIKDGSEMNAGVSLCCWIDETTSKCAWRNNNRMVWEINYRPKYAKEKSSWLNFS